MNLTDDKSQLCSALKVLKKLVLKKKENLKKLFADDVDKRQRINLVVSLCKLPPIPEDGKVQPMTIRSFLPHSFVDELTDVLLVTKNVKGYESKRSDYTHSTTCFKDLLREHDALGLVTEVMSINQLAVENKDFECKRNLASRFDIVLCDDYVIDEVPQLLGKPFYDKKKRPIQINLKAKNVKNVITRALSKSYLHLNLEGASAMVQIGRLNQNNTHLAENIIATVQSLRDKLPGGWANLRSLHIKTDTSRSLPLYINPEPVSSIPPVEHPYKKQDLIVAEDQLSTLNANHVVRVFASGKVVVLSKNEKKKKKELVSIAKKDKEYRTRYDPASDKVVTGLADRITKAKLKAKKSRLMPYKDFRK